MKSDLDVKRYKNVIMIVLVYWIVLADSKTSYNSEKAYERYK